MCQLEGRAPQPRQSSGYCKEILGPIFVRPGTFRGQQGIHLSICWLTSDKARASPLFCLTCPWDPMKNSTFSGPFFGKADLVVWFGSDRASAWPELSSSYHVTLMGRVAAPMKLRWAVLLSPYCLSLGLCSVSGLLCGGAGEPAGDPQQAAPAVPVPHGTVCCPHR